MRKIKDRFFGHPELKLVLFFIGYAVLSWPIFTENIDGIGGLYSSLFLLWAVAIVILFLSRDSR